MSFGTLEILAVILIVISVIKLIIIAVNPQCWLEGVAKIYGHPGIVSVVSTVLAAIVLFFLVTAGITITQILAVTLFVALLMTISFAPHVGDLVGLLKDNIELSHYWLATIFWVLLLVWGIQEIFFS